MTRWIPRLDKVQLDGPIAIAGQVLAAMVEGEAYIGDVYSLGYETALVQVRRFLSTESWRHSGTFILARHRIAGETEIDVRVEDSSVILLRVLDHADLPNSAEALRVRVENAQQVSGEVEKSWDHRDVMDASTAHLLSYAGVRCRVIGTYYVGDIGTSGRSPLCLVIRFGY